MQSRDVGGDGFEIEKKRTGLTFEEDDGGRAIVAVGRVAGFEQVAGFAESGSFAAKSWPQGALCFRL